MSFTNDLVSHSPLTERGHMISVQLAVFQILSNLPDHPPLQIGLVITQEIPADKIKKLITH